MANRSFPRLAIEPASAARLVTGQPNTKGDPGTGERPVVVGSYNLGQRFWTSLSSGPEYSTTERIAKGRGIIENERWRGSIYIHEAIDWNVAHLTTGVPIRVDSESLAAPTRAGPFGMPLYPLPNLRSLFDCTRRRKQKEGVKFEIFQATELILQRLPSNAEPSNVACGDDDPRGHSKILVSLVQHE